MAEKNTDPTPESPVATKPPRKLVKRLGAVGGVGLIVLVGGYLFATSGTFVKSFVLPKVGEALNAKVTVSNASVGVLGGKVELQDLLVQADDTSLVSAKSARLRYSFWPMLGGRVRVSELTVDSPEVYVVKRADGSSNVDPIVAAMGATEEKEETTGEIDLLLENLALKNAKFRFDRTDTNGVKQVMEAAEVMIEIDRFGSGIDGNLKMSTRLSYDKTRDGQAVDTLRASVNAGFKFAFDAKLLPQTFGGDGVLKVTEAQGNLQDVNGLKGDLRVGLDMKSIKQLELVFSRDAEALGRLAISGPYDIETQSADLTIEIKDIGKSVLNLAAAPAGIRVGDTKVNSTIKAKVQDGGKTVDVDTQLKVASLSVIQNGVTTPTMDIDFGLVAKLVQGTTTNLSVSKLQLTGVQGGSQFLSVGIDRPLEIPVGEAMTAIPDAGLAIKVTDFDLAPWSPLSQGMVRSGVVNLDANAKVTGNGQLIGLTLNETVRNFSAQYETNAISGLDVDTKLSLWATNIFNVKLETFSVDAKLGGQSVVLVQASGGANLFTKSLDLGSSITVDIARALQLYPVPDVQLSQGIAAISGRVRQTKNGGKLVQNVDAEVRVANLSGSAAGSQIDRFGVALQMKGSGDGSQVKIEQLVAPLTMAGLAAGTVYLDATASTDGQNIRANFGATNLNVNLFRPFVQPALGELQLASLDLSLSGSATVAGDNKSAKGKMNLANLVILDPKGSLPSQPIGLTAAFDVGAGANNSVKIPLFQGDVSIGNQPGGQFTVNGSLDGATGKGDFKLGVNGINQNLIAPFAGAALGDKRIQSVAINARANAKLDLNGRSDFDAKAAVTNLVVLDPSGAIPPTPLGVGLDAKGSMNGKVLDLQNVTLALAPTSRADNRLSLNGRVDLTDTNATAANLKINADALDLTAYYDLFAGSKSPQAAQPTPPVAPAPPMTQEPPPFEIPLKNSRIETRIGKIFLREIEITNTVINAAIDRQTVQVTPLQMWINGGKVDGSVDLNTGVPGMKYDLAMTMNEVPIQPAVRSFASTLGTTTTGDLVAQIRVQGEGQTGASLQRTLNGGVSFYLTNAMIQIPTGKQQPAAPKQEPKSLFGAALGTMGGMLRSFGSGAANAVINQLGLGDLTKSPITHVSSVIQLGQGNISVERVDVRSKSFIVLVNGVIPIAPVLNDSPLNLPVQIWLDRKAASHLSFSDVGNEPMAQLPELVRIIGTLGAPNDQVNKANVTLLTTAGVVKGAGNLIPKEGKEAIKAGGSLLQGLLGGGKKPMPNQQPTTNAPPKKTFNPFELIPR